MIFYALNFRFQMFFSSQTFRFYLLLGRLKSSTSVSRISSVTNVLRLPSLKNSALTRMDVKDQFTNLSRLNECLRPKLKSLRKIKYIFHGEIFTFVIFQKFFIWKYTKFLKLYSWKNSYQKLTLYSGHRWMSLRMITNIISNSLKMRKGENRLWYHNNNALDIKSSSKQIFVYAI